MRVGIIIPSLLMANEYFQHKVFAPGTLAIQIADTLKDMGHEPVMYSSADVKTKAKIVSASKQQLVDELKRTKLDVFAYQQKHKRIIRALSATFTRTLISQAYQDAQAGKLDVLHSLYGFMPMYFAPLTRVPTVFTIHDSLFKGDSSNNLLFNYRHNKKLDFVSISRFQRKSMPELHYVANVYNGIDVHKIKFEPKPRDEMIWLGRFLHKKGLDTAIKSSTRAGVRLNIATRIPGSETGKEHWQSEIVPLLKKGNHKFSGFIADEKIKSKFLAAKALLFPIRWNEPFGLVVAEAMAAGTPVIAFKRGAVPEIVKNGVNGFVVKNQAEMTAAINRIDEIDRATCRRYVEDKLSVEAMVDGYVKVYEKLIKKSKG